MKSGIYKITVERQGAQPKYYIGQAINLNRRWVHHKSLLRRGTHRNQFLQKAFVKYGETSFVYEVLILCSPGELTEHEQRILDTYSPRQVYNVHKRCVSSRLGVRHSDETRAKIGAGNEGKKLLSEEARARISAAQAWKRTEEGRRRLSEAQLGKTHSAEARKKISLAQRGKKMSVASIAAGQATRKAKEAIYGPAFNALRGKRVGADVIAKRLASRAANAAANGFFFRPESREAIAIANRSRAGIAHSEEHKRKIGIASKAAWAKRKDKSGVACTTSHSKKTIKKPRTVSVENRHKISAAQKGKVISSETRAKISIAKIGTRASAETKALFSAIRIGKKRPQSFLDKMTGRKNSPETILRMSEAAKKRHASARAAMEAVA
jgi:group I intron endonuclease